MTYLICKNNVTEQEIDSRRKYIYDVFHIYTFVDTKNSDENVIVLKSMPYTDIDLFLIIGHNNTTNKFLEMHYKEIKEKNVLIISCYTKHFSSIKLLKDKRVYTPIDGEETKTYYGEEYGFDFEITFEEIRLYRNRKLDLEELLNKIFRRNQVWKN